MKKKLFLLLGVCLIIVCASSAIAAVSLKRLGAHPFSQPMTSEADLRSLVKNRSADLQAGFAKAGYPDLYKEFSAQFPTAAIDSVKIAPGQQFDWMLFRNKGTGAVKVVKDVTWDGKSSFDAYRFYIDREGKRYEFIVPLECGNLSLMKVGVVPVPPPPVNRNPACKMTLSSTEITCGKVISVDATGSTDTDGTISEVVFQLLDASNKVVAEKRDNEAPFIQELTVPCGSSQYTVKTVVIDNKGAQSSPAECTQTVTVAERKGGPVADIGISHMPDPATYVFGRVGYEVPLTEKLYAMGLLGGYVRFEGDDGDDAFTVDALLNYYFTEKLFIGAGAGFWSGDDGEVDLILNAGYQLYEKPGTMKMSLFLEGRSYADDFGERDTTRYGAGLRFRF